MLRHPEAAPVLLPGAANEPPIIIVAEVAMAMALLTAAGLMVRSMAALNQVDLGFNPRHLLTATVSLSPQTAANTAASTRIFTQLRRRAAAQPGSHPRA